MTAVKAVFFDVRETVVDETRIWEERSNAAAVPRFIFLGILGGLAARPSPEFFARVVKEAGCEPREVAYVGDRNDIVPAAPAGLVSVFLRRGPWGFLQTEWPEAAGAHARIDSLAELPAVLRAL